MGTTTVSGLSVFACGFITLTSPRGFGYENQRNDTHTTGYLPHMLARLYAAYFAVQKARELLSSRSAPLDLREFVQTTAWVLAAWCVGLVAVVCM